MKAFTILLVCVAIAVVAAKDKKGPPTHHDVQQHDNHGPHQQLKQQESHDQHHQQQQHPAASQQHSLKQNQEHHAQPAPYKHKREAPKDTPAGSTTAAPKAKADPKQPSVLPAIVGQAPKTKRDTVAAQPAARPATNAPPKVAAAGTATANGQNRRAQSGTRPTVAKQSRDQATNKPQTTGNSKVPAAVNQPASNPTTASPAKKV